MTYRISLVLCVLAPVVHGDGRFQPGPLTRERVTQAAEAAGFRVIAVSARSPVVTRSAFPFVPIDYDDPLLDSLRRQYPLADVVAGAPDEWTAQLRLKEWVHKQLPGGMPEHSPQTALEVLKLAVQGEKFYCTQYTIAYTECAQALGWQARKIGVDRRHGPEGLGSTHGAVSFRGGAMVSPVPLSTDTE